MPNPQMLHQHESQGPVFEGIVENLEFDSYQLLINVGPGRVTRIVCLYIRLAHAEEYGPELWVVNAHRILRCCTGVSHRAGGANHLPISTNFAMSSYCVIGQSLPDGQTLAQF